MVHSALGSPEQKVEGLDGGDDYPAKPFATDELLARLRAVTRRPARIVQERIMLEQLVFEIGHRRALIGDLPLDLPRRVLLVLEVLLLRGGRAVAREALEQAVCGQDDEIVSDALDSHVARLRHKVESAGLKIHAMRGIGYLLRHGGWGGGQGLLISRLSRRLILLQLLAQTPVMEVVSISEPDGAGCMSLMRMCWRESWTS